jgi:tripartite-type tricarboxylate transporter receptor subunit TctC
LNRARRYLLRAAPGLLAGLGTPALVAASEPGPDRPWPSQPLRLIVVYPSGGLSDVVARALAEVLSHRLAVPVWVDHRAGAGGRVGLQALARAAPDGHTLAFSAISPLTWSAPPGADQRFDPQRDIAPVAGVMFTPVLLVGTPAFRGHTFDDLLRQARERPGSLRWATSGVGTVGHLVLEQVQLGSGVRVTHVPYKGGGQQLNDALGGQFELLSTNAAPVPLRHIEAGRFKALAVGAPRRLQAAARVPTFEELGLPRANIGSLFGVFAPGATPSGLLDRLQAEIHRVTGAPGFLERLLGVDNLPAPLDRATLAGRIDEERRSRQRLRDAGIRIG